MRRRVVLAIAGVTAGALVLFGLPLALALQRAYRDEALARLQRDTVAATRGVDLPLTRGDRLELPRFDGQIAVYSLGGRLIAGTGPPGADATVSDAIALRSPEGSSTGDGLVVASPLFAGERITGVVRGRRTQGAVDARAHRAWLEIAALAAAVLLVACGAGVAFGRRLAAPLEALAAVARRTGEGDFATRATPTGLRETDDLGTALNAGSERIGELVTREREFSANASHQLRTPLAALRLELEAALLEAQHGPRPDLTAALEQVERLESTIATLLDLAHGPGATGQGTMELGAALDDLQSRWHGPLAAAGRALRVELAPGRLTAHMSPAVFDEIADILLQNAVDHGAGTVSITARAAERALAVDVGDQGPGFAVDPEVLFARGAGTGEGIGLSLARSLAHSAGALLQVTRAGPRPRLTLLIDRCERPQGR